MRSSLCSVWVLIVACCYGVSRARDPLIPNAERIRARGGGRSHVMSVLVGAGWLLHLQYLGLQVCASFNKIIWLHFLS